jgi:parvulin-like peptidyl-prolyl isomerase
MKVYKRILIGLLSVSMMATLFTGCSSSDTSDTSADSSSVDDASTDDSSDSEDDTSDTTTAVTLPDNLDYTDEITDGVIMNVGGYDIDIEEYRYYFMNLKYSFDYGDDTYWDGEDVEEVTDEDGNVTTEAKTAEEDRREKLSALKDYVTTFLTNNYSVELMAKDYGVELTDEELADVDNTYEEYKESYESSDYKEYDTFEEYLASTYCTKELYMKSITRQALESKLIRTLYEDDMRENVLPEYYHCKHILFSTLNLQYDTEEIPDDATDEETAEIEARNDASAEAAKAEIKAKAEEVLAKLQAGEDFDTLLAEYNEDTGETVNDDGTVDGYYFKEGTMVTEFEDAFMALEDNQISDIVETSYGYHIIERLPIDEQYVEDNILNFIMYDMSTGDTTDYYDDYVSKAEEYTDSIEVTYNDLYYDVNTNSVIEKSSKFPYAEDTTTATTATTESASTEAEEATTTAEAETEAE